MARVANPKQYDRFIAAVKKDLKITDVKIYWRATMLANWAGSANKDANTITILKEQTKQETMRIIAHELKHIWQYNTGIFTGGNVWNGTRYERKPIKRGKVPKDYYDQPWESDAEKYANAAILAYGDLVGSSIFGDTIVTPVLFSNGNVNYKQTAIKAQKEGSNPFFKRVDRKKMQRIRKILGY